VGASEVDEFAFTGENELIRTQNVGCRRNARQLDDLYTDTPTAVILLE
jgi:hypothetical protein